MYIVQIPDVVPIASQILTAKTPVRPILTRISGTGINSVFKVSFVGKPAVLLQEIGEQTGLPYMGSNDNAAMAGSMIAIHGIMPAISLLNSIAKQLPTAWTLKAGPTSLAELIPSGA
jgi:hypothetical protein